MKNEAKMGLRREQGGNEEMMHSDAFLLRSCYKSLVSEKSDVYFFLPKMHLDIFL